MFSGGPNQTSSPISQMLTGGGSQGAPGQNQMQQGPSAQQPSGMPGPVDPAKPIFQTMVMGLKKLASLVTRLGDARTGNKIDQMAVDLDRELIQRTNAQERLMKATAETGGANPME